MKRFLLQILFFFLSAVASFAQTAPAISYSSPQTYNINVPIPNLVPVNTGGTVPGGIYDQVGTFAGSGSGFNSPVGVATDAFGNVYVADAGNNLIRKITSAGVVSIFAGSTTAGSNDGAGVAAKFSMPYGVATDAAGNVYVADAGNNRIRMITPAGVVTTYAGSGTAAANNGPALTASFKNPSGLAVDLAGNVYVADNGNNQIRKISSLGIVSTLAGTGASGANNGAGSSATFKGVFGVATDASGNVYVADPGNNMIRKITPAGVVSTLAGNGTAGFTDGTGAGATFSNPNGVTVDAQNNVYVADSQYSLIRKITAGGVVTTFAGSGYYGLVNGNGTAASFSYPMSISINTQGDLFVGDNGNNAIRKIFTTGFTITPALPAGLNFDANTGIISGTPTALSTATTYTIIAYNQFGSSTATVNIEVIDPTADVTLSSLSASTGTLTPAFLSTITSYVINVPNATNVIQVTPTARQITATLKVNGSPQANGSSSAPIALSTGNNTINILVTAPNGVTTQTYQVFVVRASASPAAPNISYVTPQIYNVGVAIPNLTPTNIGGAVPANSYDNVSTLAGNGSAGFVNSTGAAATFNQPFGVAADAQGNVYVADFGNNAIRKVTPGGVVTTFSTGGATPFLHPQGVAVDAQGNVYVADSGNNLIKKITPAGVVSIFAGDPLNTYGYVDGPASTAAFRSPSGIAVDIFDNVYVADESNYVIRKITQAGVVSTLAGNGTSTFADGQGTAAGFIDPYAVACDAAGNVYIAELTGDRIRKVTPSGLVSTLAGNGTAGYNDGTGTAATFDGPWGLTVDSFGNVFVADAFNFHIRKITPAGVVSLFAGAGGGSGFADGVYQKAKFGLPIGITIDPQGNLYIGDNVNNAIRKLPTTGYLLDPNGPNLPAGLSFDGTTGTISGTPTASSPLTFYTITGYNLGGSSITHVSILVKTPSTDATLSSLTPSSGTLTPIFASGIISYTATVSNATTTITLTPVTTNSIATVKINGIAVASGTASAALPLAVGNNTITTVVTAQDGVTKMTYTVIFHRRSAIALLSNINISSGVLTPVFASLTNTYTAIVSNATTNITLTPFTASAVATVTVNGVTVVSGTASLPLPLSIGLNAITIIVTAEDGNKNTYIVNVTRPSTDATLSNLTISQGTLTPAFAAATTSYTALVGSAVSSIILTPTAHEANATIKVNGITVASGTATAALPLSVGTNTFTTVVTAQDGITTKTYTLIVTRPSTDATLSSLTISQGTLTPAFAAATTSYTALVGSAVSSIILTPTAHEANATIKVNGVTVASGTATAALTLNVGPNTFTTVVTAQDGITTKTYTLIVTRPSTDATLSNLTISQGTLTPAFAAATTSYTALVGSAVSSIILTPTAHEANATIKVNGITVASGTATAALPLGVGTNTFTTVVTAQDGITTKTYTLIVTRPSTDATLSNLTISQGTLTPAFAAATTSYTAFVGSAVSSILLTPTAHEANATIKVNGVTVTSGTATSALTLSVGPNTFTTVVTAQDGITTKTYTLIVTRPSTDATLSNLMISQGTLTPAFAAATTSYTALVGSAVSSIILTPTAHEANATIKVNGITVASGTATAALPLSVGPNTFTTVVTAQDGITTKTYTLIVTRPSTDATLSSLAISQGTLTPAFAAATTSYTALVGSAVSSIILTPTAHEANATIKVNGVTVASGTATAALTLNVGPNTFTTVVTAQDGITTKTYTLIVTRPSTDATLSSLAISQGSLTPAFAAATTSYTALVGSAVSSIILTPTAHEANATIKVNGVTVASGTATAALTLNIGPNTFTTVVTAQDGITTKTYTLIVTRPSTDATLSNLTISQGTLTPAFAAATTSYTALVGSAVSSIILTPTAHEANATIKVNGVTVASGTATAALTLNIGPNTFTTVVTAQDGITTKTYTLIVTRPSTDATLSSLTISQGTLTPAFAAATTSYTALVGSAVSSIILTPTAHEANATIKVNGITVASGTATAALPLSVGTNTFTTVVTAQDGITTKTYTLIVTRPSTDATLSSLTISQGTLTPAFAAATTSYTALVGSAVSSIILTPTAHEANATIKVNGITVASGTATSALTLNVGPNTFTTVVTAQDGITTQKPIH